MPLCYIFATYRLYRLYTQSALYFCIPINLIYFMLGCSMYLQIHTVCTYALLKYNTQLILYTYLQCSIYIASPLPIYSLHSLHPTHTTCVYTPCKLPGVPMYSPCTPDINHWQLQKHCPCRTVVVGNPPSRPHGAGNHLAGRGCVMIPAHIRIYIYILYRYTHTFIIIYLYKCKPVQTSIWPCG